MAWKSLWHEARGALSGGDFERTADLFARSLFEAQHTNQTDDPAFAEFLKERNQFYQVYKNQTQGFRKLDVSADPFTPFVAGEPADEFAVWRLCSLCGNSSVLCGCRQFVLPEIVEASQFKPGEMINSRYQVVRVLGVGGMAVVYLVRNESDALFAVKVLNAKFNDEKETTERFEREARLISTMRHPNIISVFDFGKMPDGRSYFVMEFMKGESLLSILESEIRLPMMRTCKIILQVCDAMAHAHELGIVHRDLKPSNIILLSEREKFDHVKIVDFGIAKLNRPWEGMESRLTQEGQVLGSPAYMSPEQCLGNDIDHRSDIYSVGCVMYQLLCGVPPFSGEHALAVLYKQVNETPPKKLPIPSETNTPRLETIVLKTLLKDPNERYQSMTELQSDLVKLMIQEREISTA